MKSIHDLPKNAGSYAIVIVLSDMHTLCVGRLGVCDFLPGVYVYLGSARGTGGIKARLGRHLRGGAHTHWHIDYLRAVGDVVKFCYILDRTADTLGLNVECAWSQALAALPRASIPVVGFGVSDCQLGCSAHLIALPGSNPLLDEYEDILANAVGSQPEEIVCQENSLSF